MSLIEEIARRAGVSKVTVSRVLNSDTAYIRPTFARRAEQIRAIAAQLHYRPNSAARAISTGRFGAIGLLVRPHGEAFPGALMQALVEELDARRLSLVLDNLPGPGPEADAPLPRLMREACVDGLLAHVDAGVPEPVIERLRLGRIPTVWINLRLPGDGVHPDEDEAARRLVRTLAGAGHRRIAYFSTRHGWRELSDPLHFSAHARVSGYQAAMADAGLPAQVVRSEAAADPAATRLLAHIVLSARDRPSAVITYRMAEAEALFAAANQLALRVPEDLVIATYGDERSSDAGLPLLVAPMPTTGMARAAAAMLLAKLAERGRVQPSQAIPFGALSGDPGARDG